MKRLLVLALAITGILAAGCIVRFGTLYKQDDTSHFVGLASNLSTLDVVAASVRVDFFDSGNRLLDTAFVSPCTRTLQVKKDSPFEAIAPAGVTANHVQTTVYPLTLGKKTVADLDVDNIEITESGDTTHIKGDIDVGRTNLFAVQVCAALLDKHGDVLKVGRHLASPSNIDRKDSGTFDVSIPSDDDATEVPALGGRPRPQSKRCHRPRSCRPELDQAGHANTDGDARAQCHADRNTRANSDAVVRQAAFGESGAR